MKIIRQFNHTQNNNKNISQKKFIEIESRHIDEKFFFYLNYNNINHHQQIHNYKWLIDIILIEHLWFTKIEFKSPKFKNGDENIEKNDENANDGDDTTKRIEKNEKTNETNETIKTTTITVEYINLVWYGLGVSLG